MLLPSLHACSALLTGPGVAQNSSKEPAAASSSAITALTTTGSSILTCSGHSSLEAREPQKSRGLIRFQSPCLFCSNTFLNHARWAGVPCVPLAQPVADLFLISLLCVEAPHVHLKSCLYHGLCHDHNHN